MPPAAPNQFSAQYCSVCNVFNRSWETLRTTCPGQATTLKLRLRSYSTSWAAAAGPCLMAGKVIFGPILQRNANVKPLGPNLIDILLNWISNGIYVTGIEGRKCGGDPIAIKMRLDKTRVITFWGLLERPCNITGPPSLLDTRKMLLEVFGSKREFWRHNPTASLPLKQRQRWPRHSKLHLRKPQVPQLC